MLWVALIGLMSIPPLRVYKHATINCSGLNLSVKWAYIISHISSWKWLTVLWLSIYLASDSGDGVSSPLISINTSPQSGWLVTLQLDLNRLEVYLSSSDLLFSCFSNWLASDLKEVKSISSKLAIPPTSSYPSKDKGIVSSSEA